MAYHEGKIKRFEEAVQFVLKIWKEEFVTFNGKYFRVRSANLYTKPSAPIPMYIAARTPASAEIAGRYARAFDVFCFP
jgi:coenzyme F420-dependent glucose-6-phosphate dehydrogenase